MDEIIQITDELRIHRLDAQNVAVEKFMPNDAKRKWRQFNGDGRGPFFSDEAGACLWILNRGLLDEAGTTDLQGALKEYKRVADKLERAVRKAVGA